MRICLLVSISNAVNNARSTLFCIYKAVIIRMLNYFKNLPSKCEEQFWLEKKYTRTMSNGQHYHNIH